MLIGSVYVRFFKSFNFDYLRKAHPKAVQDPWEATPDGYWYPYVQVQLERGITTVVGANESGKSQLLGAVSHALSGTGIERADFCRYSQFFAVDREMSLPDFGVEFVALSPFEKDAVAKACDLEEPPEFDSFCLFRLGSGAKTIYLETSSGWSTHTVKTLDALDEVLPSAFEIDADVPLPASVPVGFLASGVHPTEWTRQQRQSLIRTVFENWGWFATKESISEQAPQIHKAFSGKSAATDEYHQQLQLADDLLTKVAHVDRSAFAELEEAVATGQEGYANGIVERVNDSLAKGLNFSKWWSQDSRFELLVTLRDQDLVFTIRDRTGTEYSFGERSHGLKYFLSYLVQYLAHEPPSSGVQEILLMDEPDAYLSSQGQQDLLRIFDEFAHPIDSRPPCQVVYVTHSPFLIDKNHGERIRVLEKGEGEEGTRVVKDVSRNHYEPLRSAFGGFVGETVFISNCNLMLEGLSDQVLLAGVASHLRRKATPKTENLDLNTLTLVPTGSASHVPYMVYLARGRDVERPAIIVLLDSDEAGDDARKALRKGGPLGKQLLEEKFVVQLGDLPLEELTLDRPAGAREIEDLVPLSLLVEAAKAYVTEFLGADTAATVSELSATQIQAELEPGSQAAIEAALRTTLGDEFHLDKVGLARNVVALLDKDETDVPEGSVDSLERNFRALYRRLAALQRAATREFSMERTSSRIRRARQSFLLDHRDRATREDALILFEDIGTVLDESIDAEDYRLGLRRIEEAHELRRDVTTDIADYEQFKEALNSLIYAQRVGIEE